MASPSRALPRPQRLCSRRRVAASASSLVCALLVAVAPCPTLSAPIPLRNHPDFATWEAAGAALGATAPAGAPNVTLLVEANVALTDELYVDTAAFPGGVRLACDCGDGAQCTFSPASTTARHRALNLRLGARFELSNCAFQNFKTRREHGAGVNLVCGAARAARRSWDVCCFAV